MNRFGFCALITTVIASLALTQAADHAPAATQETAAPDYSSYKQSYRVPYGNTKRPDFEHLGSLDVRVQVDGGPPMLLQVDTGSWGVVLGAADVPHIDKNGPPGNITYSSSGIEFDGVWTPVTLTFPDSKDEQGNVATAIVPILAVTERKTHPGAVNSSTRATTRTTKNPRVFMFGIGSGRGKEAHQERNPWVNLKEMQAGTMRRGYTLTPDGITLGLTTASIGRGYLFEKLTPHIGVPSTEPTTSAPPGQSPPMDWDSSRGSIVIGDDKPVEAGMLLDTGLTNMMIELPEVKEQKDVPPGTDVTVNLLGGRLHYSFKVGDKENPATPRRVTWTPRADLRLINTGLKALAHFDYLYDADGGYLGLRPR